MPIWSPWRHIPTQKIPKYPPGASTPDFASNCQKRFFGGFDLSKHFVIGNTPILTSVPVFSRVKFLLGVVWSLSEAQRSVLNLFCRLRYSTPFCPLKIFSRSPACPPRLVQLVFTPVLPFLSPEEIDNLSAILEEADLAKTGARPKSKTKKVNKTTAGAEAKLPVVSPSVGEVIRLGKSRKISPNS